MYDSGVAIHWPASGRIILRSRRRKSCIAGLRRTPLDEVVVTATLGSAPAIDLPASVTVLDQETLRDAGRSNFEDVLGLIANLNWAGDTSLPRYFQLRTPTLLPTTPVMPAANMALRATSNGAQPTQSRWGGLATPADAF